MEPGKPKAATPLFTGIIQPSARMTPTVWILPNCCGLPMKNLRRLTLISFSPPEKKIWFGEIFAVMYTDTKFRYIEMIDNQIDTLVSEGKARSEFLYDVEVDPINDKILTLSTCTAKYGYVGGEAKCRFVVIPVGRCGPGIEAYSRPGEKRQHKSTAALVVNRLFTTYNHAGRNPCFFFHGF